MKVATLHQSTLGQKPHESSSRHDSSFWSQLISRAAKDVDIDPRLAVLVASHESGLNPGAMNQTSGAIGIMQLMPATAAGLGVNPHNVMENIMGGVHYLRQQFTTFKDTTQALAAYNWGPGHVSQAIERWGQSWLDHAPTETRNYVNSVISQLGTSAAAPHPSVAAQSVALALAPGPPVSIGSNSVASILNAAQLRILQAALDDYLLSGLLG